MRTQTAILLGVLLGILLTLTALQEQSRVTGQSFDFWPDSHKGELSQPRQWKV